MKKVKDWLPDFYESTEGNKIRELLDSAFECKVDSEEEANSLINLRLDLTIAWVKGFYRTAY